MAQSSSERPLPHPTADWRARGAWIALALLACALRAWGLTAQSLWSDEDITLDRAQLPLGELLAHLPVEHAPGYFVLLRGWTRLAGEGDLALRFPSLVGGVLAVVLGAYVASRLVGRRAGLVLGLLLAVNPFLVWYGQEARMYTLLAATSVGALACVLRAESAERPGRWWVAAGTLTALAVYTHYYGALLVLTLVAWGLLDLARHGRTAAKGWLMAGATAFVLFLPWLPRSLAALGFPGGRAFLFQGDVFAIAAAWSAGTTLAPEWSVPITWLYLVLAGIGLLVLLRLALQARDEGAWRALLCLAVPLAAMALLVLKTQDFHPRYFFAALPAAYLVVAAGVAALPRPLPVVAAGLLVLAALPALVGLHTDPRFQKQDYRAFLRMVETVAGHEDTVLFLDGPSLGLSRRYEVEDSPVKIVNIREEKGEPPPEKVARRAAELADEFPHLWLAENGEANGDIGRWLDEQACWVSGEPFQDVTLSRYYAGREPDGDRRQGGDLIGVNDDFIEGNRFGVGPDLGPVLMGWDGPLSVRAGDVLTVGMTWMRLEVITQTLKVSIRLVPADGQDALPLVAVDRQPLHGQLREARLNEFRSECFGLLVPADAQAGDYRLDFVLYEAETGREIRRLLGDVSVEASR